MSLQGKRVCIDPGHPSEVGVGTQGKRITEVKAAWEVALKLEKLLQDAGAEVKLTKSREREMVRNRRRAEIANTFQADLMVRLHCDSAAGTGYAVYYPTRQGRAADGGVGPNGNVLAQCKLLAGKFFQGLSKATKNGPLKNRGLKSDLETSVGGKQGALTGSIYTKVPVVLIEMCVLTNSKDDAFMASKAGQQYLAEGIAAGVTAALE
ncbi:MAG: N-acetylmuramoyl-L-alanine amidase [Armatimonas sp.]